MARSPRSRSLRVSRRQALGVAAGAVFAGTIAGRDACAEEAVAAPAIKNGRLKQSIVPWCFADYWTIEQIVPVAKQLGCQSVELVDPKYFPLLRENGLVCAIGTIDLSPDPCFIKGMNNPKYRDRVLQATRIAIDACAEFGFKNVISFTGLREGIPDDVGAQNCVEGYRRIIGHAEKKGVTLCLEVLNSRDTTHPMKGVPDYQGDHTDYCVDIIKKVGSPHLKLLFDIFHVQAMDGDLVRRIHQLKEYIGHVHTAGNPGRNELDENQEINYVPVMKALVEIGYDGFVGHEFMPTRDPLVGLRQAVELCDV